MGYINAFFGLLGVIIGALITAWVSNNELNSRFRLAAVEKRLEVYQNAYTLWRRLYFNLYNTDGIWAIALECQDFWEKNCLYLDQKSRDTFNKAYMSASNYCNLPNDDRNERIKKDMYKQIESAGETITKGATLSPIGKREKERINRKK